MDDPYFGVKEEIEQSLTQSTQLRQNLKRLTPPTLSTSSERSWTLQQLTTLHQDLLQDYQDVAEAVSKVASNPQRFGVDAAEVSRRRDFVARVQRTVEEIGFVIRDAEKVVAAVAGEGGVSKGSRAVSAQANSNGNQKRTALGHVTSSSATPLGASDRELLMGGGKRGGGGTGNATKENNDKFVDRENGMQQMIMKDQDQQLEGVMVTVGNMKEIAQVMNQELDDQTALLVDLDTHVDSTQGKLDKGMKRLKEFIDQNADTKQQWTICCLIIALVVLVVIVFSM